MKIFISLLVFLSFLAVAVLPVGAQTATPSPKNFGQAVKKERMEINAKKKALKQEFKGKKKETKAEFKAKKKSLQQEFKTRKQELRNQFKPTPKPTL